jgi:hypothetical protein
LHRQRLTDLRDRIAALPDAGFCYDEFLQPREGVEYSEHPVFMSRIPDQHHACETAACVAGWACILYHPGQPFTLRTDLANKARKTLELNRAETEFLFFWRHSQATREDAVRRLNHLITNGDLTEYPYMHESWIRNDGSVCDDDVFREFDCSVLNYLDREDV